MPLDVLLPLRPSAYCGAQAVEGTEGEGGGGGTFHVPGNIEAYLKHVFGPSFMEVSYSTPSNGYKRFTCRLWNA